MDYVKQNIQAMAILPPHCPMTPHSYTSFFNDNNKLSPVAPYKLVTDKNKRDGIPIQRLEYNNFYTDWKQDSLRWYNNNNNNQNNRNNQNNQYADDDSYNKNSIRDPYIMDKSMELFEQTKRQDAFAVPLPTNGTNQVGILFNDKCNVPTFNYRRYATQPVNNTDWFYNRLYLEDTSGETQMQKAQYFENIEQNNMDIYSSVFEDMYLLELNDPDNNNSE
jgi:hypothetical protein